MPVILVMLFGPALGFAIVGDWSYLMQMWAHAVNDGTTLGYVAFYIAYFFLGAVRLSMAPIILYVKFFA